MCPILPLSTVLAFLGLLMNLAGCSLSRVGNPGLFPGGLAESYPLWLDLSHWYLKWPTSPQLKQWLQQKPPSMFFTIPAPSRANPPLLCRVVLWVGASVALLFFTLPDSSQFSFQLSNFGTKVNFWWLFWGFTFN